MLGNALVRHMEMMTKPLVQQPAARALHSHSDRGPSLLDKFGKAYTQRRLDQFHVEGGVSRAAAALGNANKIMILTGFNVDLKENGKPLPETDGPPGAAMLAISAARLGKIVTMVTDNANKNVVKKALEAIDKDAAANIKLKTFEKKGEEAVASSKRLLNRVKPDAVVALELPGRNSEGIPRNMRGKDISDFNPPLDEILIQANKRDGIVTIGIGDGGNEAGMGGLPGLPQKALDGSDFASTVPAKIPVTSFTSNNAGAAIGATMMVNAGAEHNMIMGKEYAASIIAALKAGAVDGVTRGRVPDSPSPDGKNLTGVDGFSIEASARFVDTINTLAKRAGPFQIAKNVQEGPFIIGMFDSSLGGAIATKNVGVMVEKMREEFGAEIRLIPVLDNGNAPYGAKTRPQIIHLVADGLSVAQQARFDAVVMACNTACTSFKLDENDKSGIDLDQLKKLGLPVLDLISNTAQDIAVNGGDKPVILSTQATAEDPMYQTRVNSAREKAELPPQEIVRIGAGDRDKEPGKDWASLINAAKHLSDDPADQALVDEQVNKYVDQIPKDASSVYLCCTHYPAFKERIEARLAETGRGHIPVIDPISVQVTALAALLKDTTTDRSDRVPEKSPVVLTTGTPSQVAEPLKKMLGNFPIVYTKFGQDFRFELLKDLLYKPEVMEEKTANAVSLPQRQRHVRQTGTSINSVD